MGILDDAIREHLELKRLHGAASSDLERLENEAFGPATRPGDPEFGGAGPEAAPQTPDREDDPGAAQTPGAGDWFDEGETQVLPQAPASDPAEATDRPFGFEEEPREEASGAPFESGSEEPFEAEPQPATEPPAEIEMDHETPAMDPPPPQEVEPLIGEAAAEIAPAPPEAPEHGIFDAGEIELEALDLEDGEEAPPGTPVEPLATDDDLSLELADDRESEADDLAPPSRTVPEEDPSDEMPVPLDRGASGEVPTQEHAFEEAEAEEDEDAADDLLEETPDFLQDAPEGERLWFEQGEPRDFDFDDD